MQFVMLVYLNEKEFYALSKDQQNQVHRECSAWHEDLVKAGKSIGGNGLQPSSTAKTLRFKNGKLNTIDGPFPETKEVIGGFEIFEFASMDEALSALQTFPGLNHGIAIEIRPAVPDNKCEAV